MNAKTPFDTRDAETLHRDRRVALGIPLDAERFQDYTSERKDMHKNVTMEQTLSAVAELRKRKQAEALEKTGA